MFTLSLGVQKITNTLPGPIYALLSGLNASTIGLIALAAFQLAERAIKDKLTRLLVIGGACAGMCYNALWYFPVLMVVGGTTALVWDLWACQQVRKLRARMDRKKNRDVLGLGEQSHHVELQSHQLNDKKNDTATNSQEGLQRRSVQVSSIQRSIEISGLGQRGSNTNTPTTPEPQPNGSEMISAADTITHAIPVKIGMSIVVVFFGNTSLPNIRQY